MHFEMHFGCYFNINFNIFTLFQSDLRITMAVADAVPVPDDLAKVTAELVTPLCASALEPGPMAVAIAVPLALVTGPESEPTAIA